MSYNLGIATELTLQKVLNCLSTCIPSESSIHGDNTSASLEAPDFPFSVYAHALHPTKNPSYDFWMGEIGFYPSISLSFDKKRDLPDFEQAKSELLIMILQFLDQTTEDIALLYHD